MVSFGAKPTGVSYRRKLTLVKSVGYSSTLDKTLDKREKVSIIDIMALTEM